MQCFGKIIVYNKNVINGFKILRITKKIFLPLICACAFLSCTDTEDFSSSDIASSKIEFSDEELASIALDNPRTLDEEEVLQMVLDFSHSVNGNTRSASSPQLSIESKYFVKNATNLVTRSGGLSFDSIPMCRVKVSNSGQEGYAIVSADERNAGVIAYVPNGKFENRDETGAGMMLKLSEATLMSEISEYQSKRISSLKKIAKVLGKDSVNKNDIEKVFNTKHIGTRSVAYEKPQSRIIKLIGPVAKTEWSQDEPYNRLLPKAYVPVGEKVYFESYYPAGCGIIAGAQALAAVAPNIKIGDVDIDWNYLTAQPAIGYYGDSKSIKMVTTLIKDMYEKTESHPNYIEREYGRYEDTSIPTVGSSSTGSLELLNYLKNYVSCGQYYSKYAPDPLLTTINVNEKMPCVAIMGGTHAATATAKKGSHAWVIDGYAICQKTTREILKRYDLYFHANMGWGGPDNGYYKVNADTSTDFETSLGTYNMNFWEITEIHSK